MSLLADPRTETDSPKRLAVLEAASRLFVTHGYGAVSMDVVAREAGVSKATLYAHFASKDRLFATIITEACHQGVAAASQLTAADAETDIRAALTGLGDRVLRFLLAPRTLAIHRVVIAEVARFPELGAVFYENGPGRSRGQFTAWLERQTAAGRLAAPDADLAADQFLGLLRGNLYSRALLGIGPPASEDEIGAAVAATVDTFLRAYGMR
jgi:TetR/AcrR family transcriptional repressor of mexJK operon